MDALKSLFSNYLLNVALLAWLAAQVGKTLLTFIATKTFVPERLVGAGGMPSAHSALVCSLTIAIARKIGWNSPEFAIAFVMAAVVMYDAMGVRRAAGEQAKVLNRLVFGPKNEKSPDCEEEAQHIRDYLEDQDLPDKELKEFLGHTPMEVLGGALLGILIAVLMPVS